jgi:hypothetical protein
MRNIGRAEDGKKFQHLSKRQERAVSEAPSVRRGYSSLRVWL